MSYIFEQAGHQVSLTDNGLYVACAPKEEQEAMIKETPELLDDWDPVTEDRETKLCFIGRDMDQDAITKALDGCLVAWTPEADEA